MNRPLNEQDEFLLSRLLDNDLSPEEAASLRTRMEREADLRNAYQEMSRIDSLLAARRADQPRIDWSHFHQQVMDQVEAQAASGRTIRLADFLRVALPLAAAASIALVVWFWPRGTEFAPGDDLPAPRIVQHSDEALPTLADGRPHDSELVIQFHRPEMPETEEAIRITYARSDSLYEEYRAMDERNRRRESGRILLASNVRLDEPIQQGLFD